MKDAYEALKQKEADLSRVRHEIESLRVVASLLVDVLNSDQSDKPYLVSAEKSDSTQIWNRRALRAYFPRLQLHAQASGTY
jgi:hypothetical protein